MYHKENLIAFVKLKEGKKGNDIDRVHFNNIRREAGFSCTLFIWKSDPSSPDFDENKIGKETK